MKETDHCENCGEVIKGGIRPNRKLTPEAIRFINFYLDKSAKEYCWACEGGKISKCHKIRNKRMEEDTAYILNNIKSVPLITLPNPFGWEYDVIGTVTSQVVMGTGVLTEISSSWSDFFGRTSEGYRSKIEEGEKKCFESVRIKCIAAEANAIIGVDIDYSDFGSTKNMIMICVSGTAIKLNNLNPEKANIIDALKEKYKDLILCRDFNITQDTTAL